MFQLRLIYLLFLLVGIQAIGTGIKVAIKQHTIEMIKDYFLPIIMKNIHEFHAPSIKGSIWIPTPFPAKLNYNIHKIHASLKTLHPNNVKIHLVQNSNHVKFSVSDISASGGARLDWSSGPIKDGCNGHIRIHGVKASLEISFGHDSTGRPTAKIKSLSVGITTGNTDVWFTGHALEKLINEAIKLLKPHLIPYFKDMITKQAPGPINSVIKSLIGNFHPWVDIGPNFAASWMLTKNPWVNSGYLCVSLAGYIFLKMKPHPPPYNPLPIPDFNPDNHKGIQLYITDYTIRSGLDSAFTFGLMKIKYTTTIDKYEVTFDCTALRPPVVKFDGKLEVNDKGKCGVSAKDKTNGKVMTFGLTGDAVFSSKEYIKNQKLFFEVKHIALSNMEIDNPNKHDIKWFEDRINTVLAETAKAINELLGQRGIGLPYIDHIEYSDIEEYPRKGYIEIFVTPKLKTVPPIELYDGEQ